MKTTRLVSGICAIFLLLLTMPQCAQTKQGAAKPLPREVMGVTLGMDKDAARRRLAELGKKQSEDRKAGELWRLRDKSKLDAIAIGFDKENKVRFVTAFVDKTTATERTRYTDIGDINAAARKDIVEPHYRYTWLVPESNGNPAYSVVADGEDPEFLSFYALAKQQNSEEEGEERNVGKDADKNADKDADADKDRK